MISLKTTFAVLGAVSTAALLSMPTHAQSQPQPPTESETMPSSSSLLGGPIEPSDPTVLNFQNNGGTQQPIVDEENDLDLSPTKNQRQSPPPLADFFEFNQKELPSGASFKVNMD